MPNKGQGGRSWAVRMRDGASVVVFLCVTLLYVAAWPGRIPMLQGWVSAVAGLYAAILIHELGHASAALACRHSILIFAVRPIAWNLPNRSVIVMAKGYEPGAGGLVAHIPRDAAAETIARSAFITAAGPLANFLTSVTAFVIATAHPSPPFYSGFQTDAAATAFGVQSVWIAIVSLLPVSSGISSDGQKLWKLRRPAGDWHAQRMLGAFGALFKYNIRLRDRPRWLIEEIAAIAPPIEGLDRLLRANEIGIALDAVSVDVARTRRLLDAFRVDFGDSEWLASCDTYFIAIWERDAARAAARAWQGERSDDDHAMLEAAAAAIMAAAGDADAAAAHLDAMNAELAKRTPFADPTFRDITRQVRMRLAETVDRASASMLPKSLTR